MSDPLSSESAGDVLAGSADFPADENNTNEVGDSSQQSEALDASTVEEVGPPVDDNGLEEDGAIDEDENLDEPIYWRVDDKVPRPDETTIGAIFKIILAVPRASQPEQATESSAYYHAPAPRRTSPAQTRPILPLATLAL